MGRGSDLFRYSGMANPDITSGARLLLEGLGTPGELADKATVKQRVEMQDLRQAKADALATPGTPEWIAAKEAEKELRMGLVAAEHDWKMKNDKGYRATIPGTEEYELARQNKLSDETAIINARSAADLARDAANPATKILMDKYAQEQKDKIGQEVLAKEMFNLPRENVTSTTITPQQVADTRTALESAAVTRAGDKFNKVYEQLRTPVTTEAELVEGYEIKPTTSKSMSAEEAQQEALKRVGLLDVIEGKAPIIDEKLVPKAGTTETSKKFTADEEKQKKIDAVGKAVREGRVSATVGLAVMQGLNPVKTNKEKIDEAEMLLKEKEFTEKQAKNYYGKSGGGGGKGDWLKTTDAMMKTYGSPDIVGIGDQADIEGALSKMQIEGKYSDTDMSDAIEASRSVYANIGGLGVDETGFKTAVQENLAKIKAAKEAKEAKEKVK